MQLLEEHQQHELNYGMDLDDNDFQLMTTNYEVHFHHNSEENMH